jgi:hypothetical protein
MKYAIEKVLLNKLNNTRVKSVILCCEVGSHIILVQVEGVGVASRIGQNRKFTNLSFFV